MLQDRTADIFNSCFEARSFAIRDSWIYYLESATEKCESPIERDLLVAMFFMGVPIFDETDAHPVITAQEWPATTQQQSFVCIIPQAKINRFRVDFLIGAKFHDRPYLPLLVVECDGHHFHEKTKEQAARDKARDRILVGEGLRVLRYTGREIAGNAVDCAAEISNILGRIEWANRPEREA